MDLNENIKIAAEVYNDRTTSDIKHAFVDGALSQVARDYWFAEFENNIKVIHAGRPRGIILGGAEQIELFNHKAVFLSSRGLQSESQRDETYFFKNRPDIQVIRIDDQIIEEKIKAKNEHKNSFIPNSFYTPYVNNKPKKRRK